MLVKDRSLWFRVGAFTDVTRTRTAEDCEGKADEARAKASGSSYPLQCLAQAAWWAAAADRCTHPAARQLSEFNN